MPLSYSEQVRKYPEDPRCREFRSLVVPSSDDMRKGEVQFDRRADVVLLSGACTGWKYKKAQAFVNAEMRRTQQAIWDQQDGERCAESHYRAQYRENAR